MDTKRTVDEIIEIIIYNEGGVRTKLCVPNVSWGMGIRYEADLLIVTKAGYCTEYEIKRSYSDFLADMRKKNYAHKAPFIYKFYYVIPESIKDKVQRYFEDKGMDLPGIIFYNDNDWHFKYTGWPHVKGGRKMFLEEQLHLARLGTLRYWNFKRRNQNKTSNYESSTDV